MAITAPVPGLSLDALTGWTASLPLPMPADRSAANDTLVPDVVVFSSAPLRLLSDLAASGLRQLIALLPTIERAVQEDSPLPLGHLAKAIGAAARQIGEGHAALLAEGPDRVAAALPRPATLDALRTVARQLGATLREAPPPASATPNDDRQTLRAVARQLGQAAEAPTLQQEPQESSGSAVEQWLGDARHALQEAVGQLDRAEERIRPLLPQDLAAIEAVPTAPIDQQSTAVWAMTEVVAAQAQVAGAYARIVTPSLSPKRSAGATKCPPVSLRLDHLASATSFIGTGLVLAVMWLLGGLWSIATGLAVGTAAFAVAALWGWRVVVSAHGVTLDLRR